MQSEADTTHLYVNKRVDGAGNAKEICGWKIEVRTYVVVSCVVPMGNVSWMFQEGWSSNLRLIGELGRLHTLAIIPTSSVLEFIVHKQ